MFSVYFGFMGVLDQSWKLKKWRIFRMQTSTLKENLHIIRSWPDFSLKCFLYQVPMCICLSVCLSVCNKSFHARKIYYASWQNSQCRRKGTNSSWLLPENKRHHWGCWLGDLPRRRLLTTTERVVCTSAIVGSSSSSSSSNETHDGKRLMRWVREEAKETVLSS